MTTAPDSGNRDTLITGDQLARMPDHELTELIDGRIVPLSPANPEHGRIEANVALALDHFVRVQKLGLVLVGDVGIFTRWNPDRVRCADIVFISHAQYDRCTKTRGFLDVAPELVVEILSPERPDTDQKVGVSGDRRPVGSGRGSGGSGDFSTPTRRLGHPLRRA